MLDVGLLGAKANLSAKTLLEGNSVFQEFKGALTEQYVQQELRASCDLDPCFWARANGGAEVDFLCQSEDTVIPIEVKAEENLQAKSLKVYCQHFHPPFSVRTSMADYRIATQTVDEHPCTMISIPLYGISQLRKECGGSACPR